MMHDYENRCPLLTPAARKRLHQRGGQLENQLNRQIQLAEARLRERQGELDRTTSQAERAVVELALRQEMTSLRQKIVGGAEAVARSGVQEFAEALQSSQDRLGVHANTLREYTALLVRAIRDRLSVSQVFELNPLPPWQQDLIAQKAIQACEETIAERGHSGDRWPYAAMESDGRNPTWPPVVQEWEAHKAANKTESGPQERIPESVLRIILAGRYGMEPKDVDWKQIRRAGEDLCRHYGPVLVIPLELETKAPPKPLPQSKAGAQFWREREDEFRKHDTSSSHELSAVWHSVDGHWTFRSGIGTGAPIGTHGPEQVFKSLAREAAQGLDGSRSPEPWVEWLDALRRAADKSTGKLLYSKVFTTGSLAIGERELERMAKSGELILPGGMIEFVARRDSDPERPKEPGIPKQIEAPEMRRVWNTTTMTIEHLFTTSANLCLELRSLASGHPERAIPSEPTMAREAEPNGGRKSDPVAKTWNDVEISFFNEHSVQITVGQAKSVKEYGELGMAHGRNGKPRRAWHMLHVLAASKGVINRPSHKDSDWKTVEKRMQELRVWLRGRFRLSADPLPFIKGIGYRANFRVNVARSYRK